MSLCWQSLVQLGDGRCRPLDEGFQHLALPGALRMAGKAGERVVRVERAWNVCDAGRDERERVAPAGGRDRDERERERLPFARAEVHRRVGRPRQTHRRDDLAHLQGDERAVRVRGPAVEVEERQLPLAVARPQDDGGAAGRKGRSEVGRVGRDAVARLEVVLAVIADLGEAGVSTTEPAVPLLTTVVPAARVLAEVAAYRSLVAQERGGGETCRGRDGAVGRQEFVTSEIGQRRRGADAETVAVRGDAAKARVLQVDEQRGCGNATVDLPGEVGAAREHGRTILEE